MARTVIYELQVHFGDCDPAGIVFFPNFNRWMDQSSLHFFMACGVPPWRELTASTGILGTPLLEIQTRYLRSATYGETLQIHTSVQEWRAKVFLQKHEVRRGETLICEALETRAFVIRPADEADRIKVIAVPEDIKALCQ